jgi:hypothetical protein
MVLIHINKYEVTPIVKLIIKWVKIGYGVDFFNECSQVLMEF